MARWPMLFPLQKVGCPVFLAFFAEDGRPSGDPTSPLYGELVGAKIPNLGAVPERALFLLALLH